VIHMKQLRTNILWSVCLLAAASAPGAAQQADAPGTLNSSCNGQNPKKTLTDWADFSRYREDNASLDLPAVGQNRVIFFGSSTTDNWGRRFDSSFFPGKGYINRGISGETTPQMLLRFQQDVIALRPAAVVFLGGTNDVAENTGPMTLEMTENNISAMAAIAQANGIKMILASQLPVKQFPWNKCVRPETDLLALTAWEKNFAAAHQLGYVDYYAVLVAPDGGFRAGLSPDGVHPDKKAYEIMAPVVEKVISSVLNDR
jgi:lysophospholipase L1-like esterase